MHEEDTPGQVGMTCLVRRQLQRVQEGNGAPRRQVYGRAHCPSKVLSNPAAMYLMRSQCLFSETACSV